MKSDAVSWTIGNSAKKWRSRPKKNRIIVRARACTFSTARALASALGCAPAAVGTLKHRMPWQQSLRLTGCCLLHRALTKITKSDTEGEESPGSVVTVDVGPGCENIWAMPQNITPFFRENRPLAKTCYYKRCLQYIRRLQCVRTITFSPLTSERDSTKVTALSWRRARRRSKHSWTRRTRTLFTVNPILSIRPRRQATRTRKLWFSLWMVKAAIETEEYSNDLLWMVKTSIPRLRGLHGCGHKRISKSYFTGHVAERFWEAMVLSLDGQGRNSNGGMSGEATARIAALRRL